MQEADEKERERRSEDQKVKKGLPTPLLDLLIF